MLILVNTINGPKGDIVRQAWINVCNINQIYEQDGVTVIRMQGEVIFTKDTDVVKKVNEAMY